MYLQQCRAHAYSTVASSMNVMILTDRRHTCKSGFDVNTNKKHTCFFLGSHARAAAFDRRLKHHDCLLPRHHEINLQL